ncbi:histidine phosphatase family protein, partial [Pseudonocardia acidicola]
MSPRTLVHFLRHGEVHNPAGVLYGRLPGFRLSENGRGQAEKVAKVLAEADLAAVVASPLQRAQETAAPIADTHGLRIVTEDGLI